MDSGQWTVDRTRNEKIRLNNYGELARAVVEIAPPLFVFGGFAEDVLINGRVTRPHSDLDVLIFRDEVDARLTQFKSLGFTDWEVWWQPRPGLPLVYHSTRGDIDLEPSVFERDARGSYFVLEDTQAVLHRVNLPADTFDYPPIEADAIAWRILSPLCLYQIRAAIETLGPFGPPREKDVAAQRVVREKFLSRLNEEDLLPRIDPL